MKIATHIGPAANIIGEEKAIEYVAKAGFDAWDFSMFKMCKYDRVNKCVLDNDHPLAGADYLKFARKLKQIADDNGIICNQSHAPFPSNKDTMPYLMRSIECTAEVGGDICVIHPDNNGTPEENAKMYLELLPFAKACGVRIATENMWNWDKENEMALPAACSDPDNFNAHLDAVNDDYLVACLDIGHAEMMGESVSSVGMIHALGKRLQALHIHDNDKRYDCHQLPFTMDVDFVPIVKALKDIGYNGYFTMECDRCFRDCPPEKTLEKFQDMAAAARKLANMIENA